MDEFRVDERTTVIPAQPETGQALGFVVAPDERETWPVWIMCRDMWLTAKERKSGRQNTRKAYLSDWDSFFMFLRMCPPWPRPQAPWEVTSLHVQAWVEHLVREEYSQSSINRKLAAVSSYYDFACNRFPQIQTPDGEIPLWDKDNPFHKVERFKVSAYGRAVYPTLDEVQRLLAAIRLKTQHGWRDMALLLGIFVTTRRSEEWLGLKWGDIKEIGEGGRVFDYRCKGGKIKRQEMPADVYRVIVMYLKTTGRWPLKDDDFVFVALSDHAKRLKRRDGQAIVGEDYVVGESALTNHTINEVLKHYGRRAGIAEEKLHIHGLRHAGARARRKRGADVLEIKDILGHANIAITQVYIDEVLDDPRDGAGDGVFADYAPRQLKLALNATSS